MKREEVAALGLLWEHDPGRLEEEHWAEPVAEVVHQAEHVDGAVHSVGDVGEVLLLELVEQVLSIQFHQHKMIVREGKPGTTFLAIDHISDQYIRNHVLLVETRL